MKIAVCLAAYNGEKWIASQLSSILGQVGVDVTIYVSIDKSDDDTLKIVSHFEEKHNNIIIISSDVVFGSAAANFFNLIACVPLNFDYYALSDQDDIWFPDKLLSACTEIINQSVDAYSSDVIAYWPDSHRFRYIKKSNPAAEFDYYFESAGPGCTYVLTHNFFSDFRGFISSPSFDINKIGSGQHDWFIYFYARKLGYRWIIHNSAKMLYRQHRNNVFGVNSGLSSFVKRLLLIYNGWFFLQSINFVKMFPHNSNFIDDLLIGKSRIRLLLIFYKFRRAFSDKFFILLALMFFFR